MEYDKRITNPDMILSCFDVKFVMANYRNKNGYFTDCIDYYADLSKCHYGKLIDIRDDDHAYHLDSAKWYNFFLPESSIRPKKKEKKYRAYTLMEFTDKFACGLPIKFRKKGAVGYERYLILNGYHHEQYEGRTVTYIHIGSIPYTLEELFNSYEWQEHYTEDFKPFGAEQE